MISSEKPNPFTTVTTLSKIIAGTLFVCLPFLAFWIGNKYGYSLGFTNCKFGISVTPEQKSPLTDNSIAELDVSPTIMTTNIPVSFAPNTSCNFNVVSTSGYGVDKITTEDKNMLCNYANTQIYTGTWDHSIYLWGKEGIYLAAGVEMIDLFKIVNNKVVFITSLAGDPACSMLDGLPVKHIVDHCMDETGSNRAIK